jgi:hemoglobin-like flavoprotein
MLFGYPIDITSESPIITGNKRFLQHAINLIQMFDTALNMLGPDIELLTDMLYDLGKKHVVYGVKKDLFPIMGDALIYTLDQTIPKHMNNENRDAWRKTFDAMSTDMLLAYN